MDSPQSLFNFSLLILLADLVYLSKSELFIFIFADVRNVSFELSSGRARRCLFSAYSGNQAESPQDQCRYARVLPAAREEEREDLPTRDKASSQAISDQSQMRAVRYLRWNLSAIREPSWKKRERDEEETAFATHARCLYPYTIESYFSVMSNFTLGLGENCVLASIAFFTAEIKAFLLKK